MTSKIPAVDPSTVPCDVCSVQEGPCIGTRGKPVKHFHWIRRDKARDMTRARRGQAKKERGR